ncbi:hypothetical protein NW765_017607 [Fusarium oxysporum]|nr:hypothetical protein NW765_017607 [Fusarium oxysporum]
MGGTGEWRNVCWVSVAVCGFYVCLIVAFLDETWYDRNLSTSEQPSRHSNFISRLSRLTGVWEVRNRFYYEKVDQAYKRFARTVIKPALFLVLVCYMLIFAWAIGINISAAILFATPNEFGGYGYSHYTVGYIYFAPIVAIVFGEIFGYFFNDYLVRRYTHKHHGLFQPETRLNMVYVSSIPMIGGLILLGQALAHRLSVVAVIFGWGLHNFGIMTTSVAISTYAADCYPEVAAEVSGWINFARAIGGFSVGYFQESWGRKVGYDGSFGTQAAIVAFAAMLVGVVHYYGHSWRLKSGPVC